jgi:hypothetical protein
MPAPTTVLDPQFSYRAEDVVQTLERTCATVGRGLQAFDSFITMASVRPTTKILWRPSNSKKFSTVRTSAGPVGLSQVDINDDLIRLEAGIGNTATRMALRRSPDA